MILPNPHAKYGGRETDGLGKQDLYARDVKNNARAIKSDDTWVPLASYDIEQVEFIAGLWRVQMDFPYTITDVRGRPFVLGKKHDKVEFDAFHYYDGHTVWYNCYGPFIDATLGCVVGRVDTATGPIWAYGTNIPAVRAFLSVVLFDRNRDMVLAAEGIKKSAQNLR